VKKKGLNAGHWIWEITSPDSTVRTTPLAWIKSPSETHRDCFRKEFWKIGKAKYNLDT
jgi:hypothetical protein